MPKVKISEFSNIPANNTDIDSINIAEGCAPSGINDAIRELMAQLKDFQTGAVGDSFNGPVGTTTAAAGAFTTLSANSTVTFTGLTASRAMFTDASSNLVTNAITGTGNVVMSASPTLTGTLTASAITASSTITGNGNWVIGNADTDTITVGAAFINGSVLRSAKSATNTLALAAYDVDGAAYTNLITLTAANAPTLALTSTGVGTINNMSIGATTASTGAFTTLAASGAVTLSGGTANGVAYLNGSNVVTSGSALTFDGTTLNNSGAFGTSTAALTLKNSSAANSSNIVEQQFFASNSFSGLDTIAKFGALNPSAGGNNYGTFYWSLANAGSPSEQMRLTSTGLGIGTSSPLTKLHVQGTDVAFTANTLFDMAIIENGASGNGSVLQIVAATNGSSEIGFSDTTRNIGKIGYDHNTNVMVFDTNGSERARITSSGNLLVGGATSDPEAYPTRLAFKGSLAGTGIYSFNQSAGADSAYVAKVSNTSCYLIYFDYNGSNVGSITTNGTTTSYNVTSDYRLKENVAPMTGALETIVQLKPCTYTWKTNGESGQGFIAHELQSVIPEAVYGTKDAVKEDGTPIYQGIDTSHLIPLLTTAIQEQQAIIESLKARLDAANL